MKRVKTNTWTGNLAKRMQNDLEEGVAHVFITDIANAAVEAEFPLSPLSSSSSHLGFRIQYPRQSPALSPGPQSAQAPRKSVSLTPPPTLPPAPPTDATSDDEPEKLDRIWVHMKFQKDRKLQGAPKERHLDLNVDWYDFRESLRPFWEAKFKMNVRDFWNVAKIEYTWVTSAKKNSKQGSFPFTSLEDGEDYGSLQNTIRNTMPKKGTKCA